MKRETLTQKQSSGFMHSGLLIVILFYMLVLVLVITLTSKQTYAQNINVWNDIDASRISVTISEGKIIPSQYRAVSLQVSALQNLLSNVPPETAVRISQSTHQLTLPMPDGSFMDFRILESPRHKFK